MCVNITLGSHCHRILNQQFSKNGDIDVFIAKSLIYTLQWLTLETVPGDLANISYISYKHNM